MLIFLTLFSSFRPVRAESTYYISCWHYVDFPFDAHQGDRINWDYTFGPVFADETCLRMFIFNDSQYNIAIISSTSKWRESNDSFYTYRTNDMCVTSPKEVKGGFTVPYNDTWHVTFINLYYLCLGTTGLEIEINLIEDWAPPPQLIPFSLIPFLIAITLISLRYAFRKRSSLEYC